MPSTTRERSVGKRISTLFSGGSQGSPPKGPPQNEQLPERPASRGRQHNQKLRKPSDHLLTPDAATISNAPPSRAPPPVPSLPPEDLVAPRAPFAADGGPNSRGASPSNSRPGSRADSRTGSRNASPAPSSSEFRHPVHSGTAPAPEHEEPPPPLLGPSRAKTYSLETEKKLKRKSWMPGAKDKGAPKPASPASPKKTSAKAWITGHPEKVPYDLGPLVAAQSVAELWDETGGQYH